ADISTANAARYRDCFHSILTRRHHREEAVCRFVEVVVVADPVQRDVDEGLREPVEGRVAVDTGGVYARQKRDRVQRVARRQWNLVDLIDIERGGNGR